MSRPDEFDVDIRWDEVHASGRLRIWDGRFVSRAANLPPGSLVAGVRLLMPEADTRRVVLLMAAWNDDGFAQRLAFARRLARRGIASVMLENPYFGRRRPVSSGSRHPVAHVVDCAIMGKAAVEEGLALLRWLSANGLPDQEGRFDPDLPITIGVSGFSMGGNIAAFITALAPFPVASAPLACPASPRSVMIDGAMRHAVAWDALGDREDPLGELDSFLSCMSVLHFEAPPHTAQAVIVAGRHDGFIPRDGVSRLQQHWKGSELRWCDEGHASLRLVRKPTLTTAVEDSFTRFEAAYALERA